MTDECAQWLCRKASIYWYRDLLDPPEVPSSVATQRVRSEVGSLLVLFFGLNFRRMSEVFDNTGTLFKRPYLRSRSLAGTL